MTIQCRTGCGKQVSTLYEQFSDGYGYVLYLDPDGKPHHCQNIEDDFMSKWSKTIKQLEKMNQINDYFGFYFDIKGFHMYSINLSLDFVSQKRIDSSEDRRRLEATKVMCNVYPAPFMFEKSENNVDYLLTMLADCYEKLGDYQNASLALSIQQRVTHDQHDKIFKILEKIESEKNQPQKNTWKDLQVFINTQLLSEMSKGQTKKDISWKNISLPRYGDHEVTVDSIRTKIRQVERDLKQHIRKKYPSINDFRKDFSNICSEIEHRIKSESIMRTNNDKDIIDFLTFGELIIIIRMPLFSLPNDCISFLYFLKNCRNDIDHYDGPDIENSILSVDKTFYDIVCNKIIEYFEIVKNK